MEKIKDYEVLTDRFYDPETGFWVKLEGSAVRIGYNPLVQESTGAFVSIAMENEGASLSQHESFGSIEAEKHVGQLKMPVSGKIHHVNNAVLENPRLANLDPYGEGWLIIVEPDHFEEQKQNLVHGRDSIVDWFEAELKKYEDKGWLAEP